MGQRQTSPRKTRELVDDVYALIEERQLYLAGRAAHEEETAERHAREGRPDMAAGALVRRDSYRAQGERLCVTQQQRAALYNAAPAGGGP